MKNGLLMATLLLVGAVVGCTPVGKMPVEIEESALLMTPGEDEALVYIVKPGGFGFATAKRFRSTQAGISVVAENVIAVTWDML